MLYLGGVLLIRTGQDGARTGSRVILNGFLEISRRIGLCNLVIY